MNKHRLALLIDAENVSASFWPEIEKHASVFGRLVVQRLYADFSGGRLSDWVDTARRHNIEPVIQLSAGKGKNSADIALTIHAMDLLHAGSVEAFCIVSSDRDFIPLATRLRREAEAVYGIGLDKADAALRSACTAFVVLGPEGRNAPTTPRADVSRSAASRKIIRKIAGDRWIELQALAKAIKQQEPDLAANICGRSGKLRNFLRSNNLCEERGDGPAIEVRLVS